MPPRPPGALPGRRRRRRGGVGGGPADAGGPDVTGEPGGRVAVVDCGTNTTRLLVVDAAGGEVLRTERVTGLGRGLFDTGRLAPDAIARVVVVLAEFADTMRGLGVAECRAVATSAAREAANGDEFLAAAAHALGRRCELLSEHDEARYGFVGATAALAPPPSGPVLVVDIGGGSTEFVYGRAGDAEPEAWCSVPLGSVRGTEEFVRSDPPQAEELSAAISVVREHLDDVERLLPNVRDAARLVGVAGTVSTVAAVELGLADFDPARVDNFVLTRAAAEDVFRTLATEPLAARRLNPGLHPDRAPVIVAGCAILVAVMR
ncbi:MAG TPA: DUF501 domain-containing protein, partial [Acidimicrobiaceae bacterium]|nr:DUF501 domain-containing protein [Acidimicrobiaceae bacterium]